MRSVLPCFFGVLLLLWPSTVPRADAEQAAAAQQSVTGSVGVGFGTLNGNTLYHISSYDTAGNGVESELKFPLQTALFGLEGGLIVRDIKGRDEFVVRLQWFTSIDNGSGQLQDSDWLSDSIDISGVGSAHPGLDIYSTSDISLTANIIDLRGAYNSRLSDSLSIGPLGGLLYQHFSYDASNLNQVGYGPYAPGYTGTVAGQVLTYEVSYVIPYVGVQSGYRFTNDVEATIDLGYSPFVSAEDRDDHVLRGKRVEGSTTGTAYFAAAGIAWNVTDKDLVRLNGQYLKIKTTGTQTQTWYRNELIPPATIIPAGTTATVNDRIDSEQISLSLLLSHRF